MLFYNYQYLIIIITKFIVKWNGSLLVEWENITVELENIRVGVNLVHWKRIVNKKAELWITIYLWRFEQSSEREPLVAKRFEGKRLKRIIL